MTTTIKFTAISPLTTQLLRARTELQQREGKLKIGRTVFTYLGTYDELDRLLDYLLMNEIPGSGANSKEARRIRELRRYLRAAHYGPETDDSRADAAHVQITTGDKNDLRGRVLDLINQLWERHSGDPTADALTDLADASNPNVGVDYRKWLEEAL